MRRLNAVVRAKRQMIADDRLMHLAIVNRGLTGGTGYAELQRALRADAAPAPAQANTQ